LTAVIERGIKREGKKRKEKEPEKSFLPGGQSHDLNDTPES
jgi:hypothetical protein